MKRSVFSGKVADFDEPSPSKRVRTMKQTFSEGVNEVGQAEIGIASQRPLLKGLSSNCMEHAKKHDGPHPKSVGHTTSNASQANSGLVPPSQADSYALKKRHFDCGAEKRTDPTRSNNSLSSRHFRYTGIVRSLHIGTHQRSVLLDGLIL